MADKVRWKLTRNAAMLTLIKTKCARFPVHLSKIIEQIPHLELLTYNDMVVRLNSKGFLNGEVNIDWVQKHLADGSQDAALLRMEGSTNTIILYNDDNYANTIQRIRFSIAHELGHFILKHEFVTSIARSGLSKEKYGTYELEAETFAQALLSPPQTIPDGFSISEIMATYDVSKEAATITWDNLRNKPWAKPTVPLSKAVFGKPRVYTLPVIPGNLLATGYYIYCDDCHGVGCVGPEKNAIHCPICGSKKIHTANSRHYFKFHERFGENILKYQNFPVSRHSKALICPNCKNEETDDGSFCKICGSYLINECSGISTDALYNNFDERNFYNAQSFLNDGSGCNTLLQGNARFCTECGCISTFFAQGIINDYFPEMQQLEQMDQPNQLKLVDP